MGGDALVSGGKVLWWLELCWFSGAKLNRDPRLPLWESPDPAVDDAVEEGVPAQAVGAVHAAVRLVCFFGPATGLFWPNDAKLVWSHL